MLAEPRGHCQRERAAAATLIHARNGHPDGELRLTGPRATTGGDPGPAPAGATGRTGPRRGACHPPAF